jgi:formamidopyrimidine-DNA glycosylase
MPELPEVQTTVDGINKEVKGLVIRDIWTDYKSSFHAGKDNIKNPSYFTSFKDESVGAKITHATRRGKNVLIHLSNKKTILIHMKMTGHLMVGEYEFTPAYAKASAGTWQPIEKEGPLRDPFNKFLHLVFTLSNKHHLVFSDMRKFAKVFITPTSTLNEISDIKQLGLEPLSPDFTLSHFKIQLGKKSKGKIKQVLMDQHLISGIGNIYSDEILWEAGVHPESHFNKIPEPLIKKMFKATLTTLSRGIDFGGDSMSDYRNIYGERGRFQNKHNAYRKTGEPCSKKGCNGTIQRKVIGGRSGHFCDTHQILYT